MQQALLEAVARTIDSHSFWVRVSSLHHHQLFYTRSNGQVHQTTCRCMTLDVIRSRRQNYIGQRWQIPEPELDRAFSELSSEDKDFRRRCLQLKPIPKDVDKLILKATYGAIDLQMAEDEDDYVPLIYRNK